MNWRWPSFLVSPALLLVSLAPAAPAAEHDQSTRTLKGHTGSVLAVELSPDGKVLATCSRDKTIKLWSARTWKLQRTLTDHTADVYSVAFSPEGDTKGRFAWGSQPGRVDEPHFTPDGKSLVFGCPERWRSLRVLKRLAKGEPRAPLTRDANDALKRLARRTAR